MITAYNAQRFAANVPTCHDCEKRYGAFCKIDKVKLGLHAEAGYCPLSYYKVNLPKPDGWDSLAYSGELPEAKPAKIIEPSQWGPPLWREFHSAPLRDFPAFLQAFLSRIPCGGCHDDFAKLVTDHPPDLSSEDALFVWKWKMHNAANRKLGKPEVSLEEARRIYP